MNLIFDGFRDAISMLLHDENDVYEIAWPEPTATVFTV